MTAEALEEKVGNLEILVTKVEERAKSNTKRIDEVEEVLKENNGLISAIKELAIETKYMREDLNKTIERMDKMEQCEADKAKKEADKWDKFKWLLVAGIVTIVLGYMAVGMGLK